MNGCLIKNTPIAVDLWAHERLRDANFFFLTHLHEDHIKGLTSSWRFNIYTSPINKNLLVKRFLFSHDLVIPLELDEPHIIPLDTKSPSSMSVTLIDANHVPGAVMFLFQGYFGSILYCGDMRFDPSMLNHPSIEESLRSGGIDQLYLDNTFCCPSYDFPSREFATQQVFKIIEEHPNHCVKLGIRKLGKEDLLEKIALKFKERILVGEEKYQQLKLMGRLDVYTTNPNESRIEALIIQRIHARNHLKWNQLKPTVSIKLTAIYYGIKDNFCSNKNSTLITVPYSDHSSWRELHEFVKGLKPRSIFPIVKRNINKKDFISKALFSTFDMSVFDSYLSPQFETTSTSFPEFIKFHGTIPKLDFGCGQSQRKLHKKKRKVYKKGVLYESFDDISDDGQLKPTMNDTLCTSLGSIVSKKVSGGALFEKEDFSGNKVHKNQLLSTNSVCVINDSSTFNNSLGNERKVLEMERICIDLSETSKFAYNDSDNSQEFFTFVDECSKDLNQLCEFNNSGSEQVGGGFETIEHSSLAGFNNKVTCFVEDRINSEKSKLDAINITQVDKFDGFEDDETNSIKENKKKLFDLIENCVHNSKVLSQTSKDYLSDLNEASEVNITHDDKFEGFDSNEQSFNVIRGRLLCFVKGFVSTTERQYPNMKNSVKEGSILSEGEIPDDMFNTIDRITGKKTVSEVDNQNIEGKKVSKVDNQNIEGKKKVSEVYNLNIEGKKKVSEVDDQNIEGKKTESDINEVDNQNIEELFLNLEQNIKSLSNEMTAELFGNPTSKKHSCLPLAFSNAEQPKKTDVVSDFAANEFQLISTAPKKHLISVADSFCPILCSTAINEETLKSSTPTSNDSLSFSTSISDDSLSFSTSVSDDALSSSTFISDDDISSSTSVCDEKINGQQQVFEQDSDAIESSNYFTTNEIFRQDMFQSVSSQLESSLTKLKEGGIPFSKLNDLCNSVELYINTF